MTVYSQPAHFRLLKFGSDFMFNTKTSSVVSCYKSELEKISPLEAIKVFTWMAQSDYDLQTISNKINKLTSIFYKPLKKESSIWAQEHFIIPYLFENLDLLSRMKEMRPLLGKILKSQDESLIPEFRKFADVIKNHIKHFQLLEVQVFPLFERVLPQYGAFYRFESMFHNDFKQMLREIEYLITVQPFDYAKFNRLVGHLYFRLSLRLYRENLILFPVGCKFIHDKFYELTFVKESVE